VTLILVASALIGVHLRFLQLLKSLDIGIVPSLLFLRYYHIKPEDQAVMGIKSIDHRQGSRPVHHCSSFRPDLFIRIQLDLYDLHLISNNCVINNICHVNASCISIIPLIGMVNYRFVLLNNLKFCMPSLATPLNWCL